MSQGASRGQAFAKRGSVLPYVLIAPLMVLVVWLSVYPAAVAVIESLFKNSTLDSSHEYVGLANYEASITGAVNTSAVINTAVYTLVGTVGCTVGGIIFALTLRGCKRIWTRGFLLGIVIAPWASPPVVSAVVWRLIYDPTIGVLNSALRSLGLIPSYNLWIGLDWFQSIVLIEAVQVWQLAPLAGLIIFAAMQGIPSVIYEAAAIDGAGPLRTLTAITLPVLRPAIAIATIQSAILAMNVFDQVYVLNGFSAASNSVMMNVYTLSFTNQDFGQGYALSVVVMIASMVISLILLKTVYRRVEY